METREVFMCVFAWLKHFNEANCPRSCLHSVRTSSTKICSILIQNDGEILDPCTCEELYECRFPNIFIWTVVKCFLLENALLLHTFVGQKILVVCLCWEFIEQNKQKHQKWKCNICLYVESKCMWNFRKVEISWLSFKRTIALYFAVCV